MKFFDIGANLTDEMFQGVYNSRRCHEPDLDNVINCAIEDGVQKMIVTAGRLSEVELAVKSDFFQNRAECLFTTVGVHPTRCSEFESHKEGPEAYVEALRDIYKANKNRIVAYGEFGLDYDRLKFCPKETQKKYFDLQLDLCHELGLPAFLHLRAAFDDFVAIVESKPYTVSGVVHSFDGTTAELHKLLELGFFIGLNGCSLRKPENLATAAMVPLDRLMLETDAPWCDLRASHASAQDVRTRWKTQRKDRRTGDAAVLVKGRNEPRCIIQVAEAVAGAMGLDVQDVADAAYRNAESMFQSKLA